MVEGEGALRPLHAGLATSDEARPTRHAQPGKRPGPSRAPASQYPCPRARIDLCVCTQVATVGGGRPIVPIDSGAPALGLARGAPERHGGKLKRPLSSVAEATVLLRASPPVRASLPGGIVGGGSPLIAAATTHAPPETPAAPATTACSDASAALADAHAAIVASTPVAAVNAAPAAAAPAAAGRVNSGTLGEQLRGMLTELAADRASLTSQLKTQMAVTNQTQSMLQQMLTSQLTAPAAAPAFPPQFLPHGFMPTAPGPPPGPPRMVPPPMPPPMLLAAMPPCAPQPPQPPPQPPHQ